MKKLNEFSLILLILIAVFIILQQIGCDKAECEPELTRCAKNIAQICNQDGFWENIIDCKEIEENWICCWVEEEQLYSCLPQEECN